MQNRIIYVNWCKFISIGDLCCVQLTVSSFFKNYIFDFIFNLIEMRDQFRTLKKSIYWVFVLNKCFQRTIIDRVFYYRLCFRFLLPILFCFCSESTFQSVQLNFILHETPTTRAKPLYYQTLKLILDLENVARATRNQVQLTMRDVTWNGQRWWYTNQNRN